MNQYPFIGYVYLYIKKIDTNFEHVFIHIRQLYILISKLNQITRQHWFQPLLLMLMF